MKYWSGPYTMTAKDATVDELAATALPAWHDFKFEVQRLRADYLLRRADGQSAE